MTVSNLQNAIIAPETSYSNYVKRIDLKQKLSNCFQKTFLLGTMKWKKYYLIKKTLSVSLARNIVSKLTRFGNQKAGNNLVLQNRFKTLDVVSSFTTHELSNCRENLNISNPSNNANNSSQNSFSNKLNGIRWRSQVVINQNPENNNNYRKSKFVPGNNLSSESGKHSSTSNNNNIVLFGGSIQNFSRKCKYDFNRNIISGRARFKPSPGATSKDLLCYINATLQDATNDATIIYVGVNNILNRVTIKPPSWCATWER